MKCGFSTLIGDFSAHSSGLTLGNSLGAFRRKQDLHRGKADAQIRYQAGMGDVHQIHLQLVVGPGIVLAVDLRVARKTGLGLQAQTELRHRLLVLRRDLRALRPGPHHGQVAPQDVHQLGQLIDARPADEASHRRDTVIVLAGGQAGHAVLLRVHPHAAKFMYPEHLAVPGQTILGVKDRAAVIEFDGCRCHQKQGGQHQQRQRRCQNIKDPLDQQIQRRRMIPPYLENREVEQVHLPCALHQGIADARRHIHVDVPLHAVFQDLVALTAADIAEEHHTGAVQHGQVCQTGRGVHDALDSEALFKAGAGNELVHRGVVAVYHHGWGGGVSGEVPAALQDAPQRRHQKLERKRPQHGEHIHEAAGQQAGDEVEDDIREQNRKSLAENRFQNALQHHLKRVVGAAEQTVHQAEQCAHAPSLQMKRRKKRTLIEAEPAQAKQGGGAGSAKGVDSKHRQVVFKFSHFQDPPQFSHSVDTPPVNRRHRREEQVPLTDRSDPPLPAGSRYEARTAAQKLIFNIILLLYNTTKCGKSQSLFAKMIDLL